MKVITIGLISGVMIGLEFDYEQHVIFIDLAIIRLGFWY